MSISGPYATVITICFSKTIACFSASAGAVPGPAQVGRGGARTEVLTITSNAGVQETANEATDPNKSLRYGTVLRSGSLTQENRAVALHNPKSTVVSPNAFFANWLRVCPTLACDKVPSAPNEAGGFCRNARYGEECLRLQSRAALGEQAKN